jgi:hypothetical protein
MGVGGGGLYLPEGEESANPSVEDICVEMHVGHCVHARAAGVEQGAGRSAVLSAEEGKLGEDVVEEERSERRRID